MITQRARRGYVLSPVAIAVTAALLNAGSASAAPPVSFSCAASATMSRSLDGKVQNPVRAGDDALPCQRATSGLQDGGQAAADQNDLGAQTAYAAVDPGGIRPVDSKPVATAGVEGLSSSTGGTGLLVAHARSTLTASCVSGAPVFTPTSEVSDISLGGVPLVVDGTVQPLAKSVTDALGAVVSVRLNELVDVPGGKAIRAAHITLLRGDTPIAETIVAESRLSLNGAACDPSAPGNAADAQGTGIDTSRVCPDGSVLNAATTTCVIPVAGSQTAANPAGTVNGSGVIVIGPPRSGPSGGSVLRLDVARTRYPNSPCVKGAGPQYVVVGTKGADRITGTNHRDRILSLTGNDRLDGGRGNDCLDGGKGHDAATGGMGRDRVHGGSGRDLINGDGGNDRLFGGSGNDTLNAAYGADKVSGGSGNDKINVATAGRQATVYGGRGTDKVRCNPREVHRMHGVERVLVTRPQKH